MQYNRVSKHLPEASQLDVGGCNIPVGNFVRKVWERINRMTDLGTGIADLAKKRQELQRRVTDQADSITWGELLDGSTLVHIEDRFSVPDNTLAVYALTERYVADDYNLPNATALTNARIVGMACRFCDTSPFESSRVCIFPESLESLSNLDRTRYVRKMAILQFLRTFSTSTLLFSIRLSPTLFANDFAVSSL